MKLLIITIILFPILSILREAFYKSLCEISSFGCVMGFIAFKLAPIIIVTYWGYKIYKLINPQ
jgi:hypothetical protein